MGFVEFEVARDRIAKGSDFRRTERGANL
jgi:hypothetical protein